MLKSVFSFSLMLIFSTFSSTSQHVSRVMRKPTICICENEDAFSFAVTAKLISAFVFATWIVQYLYFLNPKFQASSHLQQLYSLVCVRTGQKPHCWLSHFEAQVYISNIDCGYLIMIYTSEHFIFSSKNVSLSSHISLAC